MEQVDLESNELYDMEEAIVFTSTSLKAFFSMLDNGRIRVRHVYSVSKDLRDTSGAHTRSGPPWLSSVPHIVCPLSMVPVQNTLCR